MTFSAVASGPDEPTTLTIHGEEGAHAPRSAKSSSPPCAASPSPPPPAASRSDRRGNSAGGAFGSGTYFLGRALRSALDDGDRSALANAATFEDGLAQQRVLDAAREVERTRRMLDGDLAHRTLSSERGEAA